MASTRICLRKTLSYCRLAVCFRSKCAYMTRKQILDAKWLYHIKYFLKEELNNRQSYVFATLSNTVMFSGISPSPVSRNTLSQTRPKIEIHHMKCQNKTNTWGCIQNICMSQVEFCSTIWHPWQKHLTEMVQRSAARYVQNDYPLADPGGGAPGARPP